MENNLVLCIGIPFVPTVLILWALQISAPVLQIRFGTPNVSFFPSHKIRDPKHPDFGFPTFLDCVTK
jgi:hypothetical protein